MIEEPATVIKGEQGFAWVETRRDSVCGACATRKACGTATLAKVLGQRQRCVRAVNGIGATVGDRVTIGLTEGALVQGSLVVYLVPVLGLLCGAGVGELLAGNIGASQTEPIAVLMGLTGMALGVAWVRRFARRIETDRRYQPVLLRKHS